MQEMFTLLSHSALSKSGKKTCNKKRRKHFKINNGKREKVKIEDC